MTIQFKLLNENPHYPPKESYSGPTVYASADDERHMINRGIDMYTEALRVLKCTLGCTRVDGSIVYPVTDVYHTLEAQLWDIYVSPYT